MPQLDTSTWPAIIVSMLFTLFLTIQLKLLSTNYRLPTSPKMIGMQNHDSPWESKWTKIYLPHLLPRQF